MLKSTKSITSNLESKINLLLLRDTFSKNSTIGELFLNGERMCDTLENPYINNEKRISCIPEGEYKVRIRVDRESGSRDYVHLLVQDENIVQPVKLRPKYLKVQKITFFITNCVTFSRSNFNSIF